MSNNSNYRERKIKQTIFATKGLSLLVKTCLCLGFICINIGLLFGILIKSPLVVVFSIIADVLLIFMTKFFSKVTSIEIMNLKTATMKMFNVSSPAFENEGWIPDEYTGFGIDKSPELHIGDLPEETESLMITLDDLGHPIQPGYNHWIAWNIPPMNIIPSNIPKGSVIENPIHIEQGKAYGENCYRGPKPPFNWNHRYVFTVYALDCTLSISEKTDKAAVLKEADEHILAKGELFGKYQRKH